MSGSDQNNSLLNQFRAAGRLVNEWRDTLSYSALAVAAFEVATHTNPKLAMLGGFTVAAVRELGRARSWRRSPQLAVAGYGTKSRDTNQLADSALFAGTALLSVPFYEIYGAAQSAHDFSKLYVTSRFVALGIINASTYLKAGGLPEIYKAYKDVMWDYPRKNGGGGTTQTQKLLDGVSEKLQRLVPANGLALATAQRVFNAPHKASRLNLQ